MPFRCILCYFQNIFQSRKNFKSGRLDFKPTSIQILGCNLDSIPTKNHHKNTSQSCQLSWFIQRFTNVKLVFESQLGTKRVNTNLNFHSCRRSFHPSCLQRKVWKHDLTALEQAAGEGGGADSWFLLPGDCSAGTRARWEQNLRLWSLIHYYNCAVALEDATLYWNGGQSKMFGIWGEVSVWCLLSSWTNLP